MSAEVALGLGPTSDQAGDRWGHPRQLWMLLAVTAAMNFGFYGFRAFLAPYIAQTFYSGLDAAAAQAHADLLASGLLALMYATPIVGGYLADKVLGEALSLLLSLWLSVLGLVLMALPTLFGFEIGMAALALSSGLNVTLSVMIGRDYATSDPRREGGYTLFYLAVNAGSFVAPFVCADWIGGRFGYRMGFIAAAVGMALAALVMQLRHHKLRPLLPHVDESSRGAVAVLAGIAILLVPTALLLSRPEILSTAMYVLMGLLVLYFIASCIRRRDPIGEPAVHPDLRAAPRHPLAVARPPRQGSLRATQVRHRAAAGRAELRAHRMAYQLAGRIAILTTSSAQIGITSYAQVYERLFLAGILVSVIYLLAAPKVRKLMHGVN